MREIGENPERPLGLRLAYLAYQGLLHLLLVPVLGLFLWRSRKEPLYRASLGQRFGRAPKIAPGAVWVFAASLGETRAVSPLVRALLDAGHRVLLTHSAPAGLSEGARLFQRDIDSGRLVQAYAPLDLFWAVRLFLRGTRPAVGLVVESEIWPGMLFEAERAAVPMIQVNGNYAERSFRRDQRRWGGLRLQLFRGFRHVLTKSEAHRARYLGTGLPASRVHLVGELKFDQASDPAQAAAADRLMRDWPKARKTLLIASSVADEEDALLHLVADLLRDAPLTPAPLIVWVPRSPQRFDAVAQALVQAGYRVARRSDCLDADLAGAVPAECEVLVGDSLGEMNFYCQLADLVFVGASLNGHGGHNIIEPLALGRPVVMGPSIFGISFPAHEAEAAGAFESLPDAAALTRRVRAILSDEAELAHMSTCARDFNRQHLGAAQR